MNQSLARLTWLRDIVRNLARQEHKSGIIITQEDLNKSPFAKAKIGLDATAGIKRGGAKALYELADSIFTASTAYQRGTTFEDIFNTLSDIIICNFIDRTHIEPTADDLVLLEDKIDTWFEGQSAAHQLYIPCIATRYPARAFSIGPVQFTHIEEFAASKLPKIGNSFEFEFSFKPLLEEMTRSAACWMATIIVDKCTLQRAWEIGELAVDIALVGIQLVLPTDKGCMSRVTGRTTPPARWSVSQSNGHTVPAFTNQQPALSIGPGMLEHCLANESGLVLAIGRRIQSYIGQNDGMPRLEQAWTDAAYWFFEGLAEPLDTIAVPKLETAIEVLLRSESTSGSKSRIIRAIRSFYGLEPDQFISPQSTITVDAFAKNLVRDRSRILHGTWSTLSHPLYLTRASLTIFVRDLLIRYVLQIDRYAAQSDASDDIEGFLADIERERAQRKAGQ